MQVILVCIFKVNTFFSNSYQAKRYNIVVGGPGTLNV